MNLSLLLLSLLSVTATAFKTPPTTTTATTTVSSTSSSALAMSSSAQQEVKATEAKAGDKIPNVTMKQLVTGDARPEAVNLLELIAGKKVVIFGVPGAFTPGCSKSHLPSFMDAQDELKAKGVELTICVATNDAFVMEAWGRTSGGSDAGILFLSDDSGELTKQLGGLVLETPVGLRTKRFSLVADDGVVTHYFSSAEEASNTWAPQVLAKL